MEEFLIYLGLGFAHITDPGGYDHILFVIALCAVYTLRQWRRVLVLVTAFTIGHSITLALATLRLVNVSTNLIELLIPITILITAITNFFYVSPVTDRQEREVRTSPLRYGLALVFGLIHGLGFSSYLRSLLGKESIIWQPLLAFNIGLELGQLLIVSLILGVSAVVVGTQASVGPRIRRHDWNLIVSGIVVGMAVSLILSNGYLAELMK
jgi:hypothetical protein